MFFEKKIENELNLIAKDSLISKIWNKDTSIWKEDDQHQRVILNRLGWLSSPAWLETQLSLLADFQKDVADTGFRHVVLLGMGGSSLAPEVFRRTFGLVSGFPELIVLDSTVSDEILRVDRQLDLARTLFIVSTKSGTTLETISFFHYFFDRMKSVKGVHAGKNFVGITDPGTPLLDEAEELGFRKVFINPADVGGRFSVLSFFGMVPAAAMGLNIKKVIKTMQDEMRSSSADQKVSKNEGALLGASLAIAYRDHRDKMTLVTSKSLSSFGLWIEQLLAESLGKEGKGIVPIFGEELGEPDEYQADRYFVYVSSQMDKDASTLKKLEKLKKAGFPVIHQVLNDSYDLGKQFYRWAFATAIAGVYLQVNPFDEPNVQEAKDWTNRFLEQIKTEKRFTEETPSEKNASFRMTFGSNTLKKISPENANFSAFLHLVKRGDYLNLAAYLPYQKEYETALFSIRKELQKITQTATMFGFGPRYLHSTGQLHKGGPNNCVMVLITADTEEDTPIPGKFFSFSQLAFAQALGDVQALNSKGRRAVHVHLSKPVSKSLTRFFEAVKVESQSKTDAPPS